MQLVIKSIVKHMQHYIPLVGVLTAGIIGFTLFPYDNFFRMTIIVATAAAYVSWGIAHHRVHDDLHITVVIEYFAVAVLGVVIAYSLL